MIRKDSLRILSCQSHCTELMKRAVGVLNCVLLCVFLGETKRRAAVANLASPDQWETYSLSLRCGLTDN